MTTMGDITGEIPHTDDLAPALPPVSWAPYVSLQEQLEEAQKVITTILEQEPCPESNSKLEESARK